MRNRWLAATTLVLFSLAILAASATFAFAAAPANDNFSAAISLVPPASGTTTGTNVGATLEPSEVVPSSNNYSIWYKWVAPSDDIVSFDTTGSVDGAGDPTAVDVKVYSSGTSASTVVEAPEAFVPRAGRVEIPAKINTTYYIQLTSPYLANQGTLHLAWQTSGNTGHITGTVTATNGGTALSGMQVDAYAVGGAGNSLRTVLTNASGAYNLTGLGTGDYQVRFTDPAPTLYLTEWYDNQLAQGSATTISVVNGATTSGKNAVLDRVATISGNVRSTSGVMANVQVQLLPYTGGLYDAGAAASTLTNTSGNYSFTGLPTKIGDGNYYLVQFIEPGGSGFTTQFYNQKSNLLLATHLQPIEGASLTAINCIWPTATPGTLAGTVTSGGSPLQGVNVTVSSSGGSATTAADGTYSIANIPPSASYSVTYSKTGYNNQTLTGVAITAGATTTRNVTMIQTPGTLTGTVTSGGSPVSGVSVSVPGTATVATTAANGTYTLAGITPGTYTVRYLKAGYNTQWVSGVSITTGATTTQNVSLIQTPGTLSGTVTSGGSPVAGVSVSVAGTATVATTAANGTYTVSGITPGTRNVMYSKAGYNSQWINVNITTGATTTQPVTLIQTPGTLSGTVTSGGSPVSGVSVSVPGTATVATTAANGTYTLAGITPGTYTVRYLKAGYNTQWVSGVSITTGATTTQNVSLIQTPGTLSGTVTSGGSPLAGVTVSVPGTATVTTAANGTYSVAGLTPGSYNVTYSLSGYTSQTINNVAITTNAVTTQDVALVQVPGTLSGTVSISGGGGPLSGVSVTVTGSGVGPTTTAGNGAYSLGSIPPGPYSVTYSKTGYTAQTIDNLVISAGLTTTQDIALVAVPVGTKPGILDGTVTVTGGGALQGVQVSVPGTGTVQTDANGYYKVPGVTPGTYSVTFTKNGYSGAPRDVIISADATTTQDVVLTELPATLTGVVTKTGGTPLQGVSVSVAGGASTTTAANGTYTINNIPAGAHNVTFSLTGYAPQTTSVSFAPGQSVPLSPVMVAANKTNVYRFRNLQNGFYLWSADESEKAFIIGNLSATWLYEGVAYTRNTVTNTAPLWRFRNIAGGYYLYSADPGEKDTIVATLPNVWQLEGQAYKVSRDPSGRKVWRFRNLQNGTYLLSADPAEKDSIVANLSNLWQLEGPAFYLAP